MRTGFTYSSRQRGYSLVEVVVAVAIFALIFIAALMVYDRSNLVFKRGIEAADTQQNTRVAFDRLVADIRMAGYDHDRDGIPTSGGGAVWQPTKTYGINNLVSPTTANGFVYRATAIGGTAPYESAGFEPAWPTTIGNTVVDGDITWRTETGVNQFQQPDEQIEFAGPTAITVRGNFDYEIDVVNDNGRENDLQTPEFPVVTTGNDEIITYALRKFNPDGSLGANPNSIQLFVDVQNSAPFRRAHPGGLPERLITIPNVDLTNSNPPYTLMRFTFDDTGALVATPVANNIRRMDFEYYPNSTGVPAVPVPDDWNAANVVVAGVTHLPGTQVVNPGSGQFNPAVPTSGIVERAARSLIRSVRLVLIGMDAVIDPAYTNRAEPVGSPARNYRTYRVESLIVPRNIGKQGMREPSAAPPGSPVLQSVCVGHCGIAKVTWLAPAPNPNFGTVDQYIIQYGTTAAGPYPVTKQVGTATTGFIGGLTPGTTYYFTVSAVNSYGNSPAKDTVTAGTPDYVQGTPLNRTNSEAPSNVVGSGDLGGPSLENQISVTWTSPVANIPPQNALQCRTPAGAVTTEVPVNIAPGEITRYGVYRSQGDPNFVAGPANQISTAAPNSLLFGVGSATFVDRSAVNCLPYYYRVQAREDCDLAAENVAPAVGFSAVAPPGNPASLGQSIATAAPAMPLGLKAIPGVCGPSSCSVTLEWLKVNTDTAATPNSIVIRDYELTRITRQWNSSTLVWDLIATDSLFATDNTPFTGQTVTFPDPDSPLATKNGVGNAIEYEYTVKALQCAFESVDSLPAKFPCTFTGTVDPATITGASEGDGLTTGTAWLIDGTGSVLSFTGTGISSVQAFLNDGTDIIDLGTKTAAPFDFPIINTEDGVVYTIDAVARDASSCSRFITRFVEDSTPSGCCLSPSFTDPLVISYIPGTPAVDVHLVNLCDDPLDIQQAVLDSFRLTYTPVAGHTLTTIDFPNGSGGIVSLTVNDTTGTVNFTPPAGFQDPVPANSFSYEVSLNFSPALTVGTQPITGFCATYRRPGVDTVDQRCKFIPQPTTPNSCN